MGTVERWTSERIEAGVGDRLRGVDALADIRTWQEALGHRPGMGRMEYMTAYRLGKAMAALGYKTVRTSRGRYFVGVKLRDPDVI